MGWRGLVGVVFLSGCSLVLNPDGDKLGGGDDTGIADGGTDAGMLDSAIPDTNGMDVPRPDDAGRDDGGPIDATTDRTMPPVDATVPDVGCTEPARCEGGAIVQCDVVSPCPLGCAPDGSVRCAVMVPSNVDEDLWVGDARDVNIPASGEPFLFDTNMCTSPLADTMVVEQTDGGDDVCVLIVHNLVVQTNAFFAIRGDRPVVIMASGDVTVQPDGVIDVSGFGASPGAGGGAAGGRSDPDGGGDNGGEPGEGSSFGFDDGGGGGGGFCGGGGEGGQGGGNPGGAGGGADVPSLLIPLSGGSGGGIGTGASGVGSAGNIGIGGAGGGAVQISALGTIRINGFVLAGGGGGGAGGGGPGNWGAGGGGGSGGGVLIEAPTIVFGDGAGVTTSGGGGGGSAGNNISGEAGEDGAFTLGRALGGGGATERYGADGGDSGGGSTPNGLDGEDNRQSSANGGGGGGGVGCVVYRTLTGAEPAGARVRTSGRTEPSLQIAPVMLR